MDAKLKEIYEAVQPGWWPILDTCIPQILAFDPDAQFEIKEKYGTLRIWAGSEEKDLSPFYESIQAAENASETVCEICGAPGHRCRQPWIRTLCDRCQSLDPGARYSLTKMLEDTYIEGTDGKPGSWATFPIWDEDTQRFI